MTRAGDEPIPSSSSDAKPEAQEAGHPAPFLEPGGRPETRGLNKGNTPSFSGKGQGVRSRTRSEAMWARRQGRFLRALARFGTVREAAKAAGISRENAQEWMQNDAYFRMRCRGALDAFADSLVAQLLRKAESGHGPSLQTLSRFVFKQRGHRIMPLPDVEEDPAPWLTEEEAERADDAWQARYDRSIGVTRDAFGNVIAYTPHEPGLPPVPGESASSRSG